MYTAAETLWDSPIFITFSTWFASIFVFKVISRMQRRWNRESLRISDFFLPFSPTIFKQNVQLLWMKISVHHNHQIVWRYVDCTLYEDVCILKDFIWYLSLLHLLNINWWFCAWNRDRQRESEKIISVAAYQIAWNRLQMSVCCSQINWNELKLFASF